MRRPGCESLYHRWQETAAAFSGQVAMRADAQGSTWTFAELREAAEQSPPVPPVLVTSATGTQLVFDVLRAWRDGSVLVPLDTNAAVSADLPPADIVHVKLTSGSTGSPRHVWFTAEQLATDAAQIVRTMGLRPERPNIGAVSMAHSYGFSNLVLPLLLHGIPLVIAESPLPERLRNILRTGDAFTLPAVPALWRAWHQAGVIDSRITLAISAGAPMPLDLEQAVFDATGVKIHNFYGSSECGGIAFDRSETPRTDSRAAGTAMDGVDLSIDAASGCLTVRSAAVAQGYAVPDGTLGGGTFVTADLAGMAADGTVILTGRAGDVINVAGRKIAPAAIEERLMAIHGVRCCVVFGVPSADPARVEEIVALVGLEPTTTLDRVRRLAAHHLSAAERPRHWQSVAGLEPDARGKLSRHAWRRQWLGGEPR